MTLRCDAYDEISPRWDLSHMPKIYTIMVASRRQDFSALLSYSIALRCTNEAVAILSRLPYSHVGTVVNANKPIKSAKIPNGSAGPRSVDHVPTKNVHAKLITARKVTTIKTTWQSGKLRKVQHLYSRNCSTYSNPRPSHHMPQ